MRSRDYSELKAYMFVYIGVERNRQKCRCMNKFLYFILGAYEGLINWRQNQVKNMVSRVVSRPDNPEPKVVADMQGVQHNPYNLVGCNITSMYGGMINKESWTDSKQLDPERKKMQKANYATSCDESDSQLQ